MKDKNGNSLEHGDFILWNPDDDWFDVVELTHYDDL